MSNYVTQLLLLLPGKRFSIEPVTASTPLPDTHFFGPFISELVSHGLLGPVTAPRHTRRPAAPTRGDTVMGSGGATAETAYGSRRTYGSWCRTGGDRVINHNCQILLK